MRKLPVPRRRLPLSLVAGAASTRFSNFHRFGDSLSDVGASRDFGKVTGYLSASASESDGGYSAVTLGARIPIE